METSFPKFAGMYPCTDIMLVCMLRMDQNQPHPRKHDRRWLAATATTKLQQWSHRENGSSSAHSSTSLADCETGHCYYLLPWNVLCHFVFQSVSWVPWQFEGLRARLSLRGDLVIYFKLLQQSSQILQGHWSRPSRFQYTYRLAE